MERNYVAFISYRHAEMDSAIAKTLHTLIEQYRIPKGLQKEGKNRLGLVFRDEEELHAASDLTAEIQEALQNTEFLIVICSENSIQSPWVGREIDYFLQHHDRSKILALLASGEPADVFPRQLTHLPDGQVIEPLAVDVRSDTLAGSKKKLRKELPRLISGILDCPYDALVMREQKRKMRRITAIAAGFMAVMLGFTSMVLAKNQQIELANTQLEHKNTELNDANTALAEQKAAVQLRESQLLTQNAQDQLDNADYYGAIETALSALPKDAADDRPYYAPAESILMEAMGIFNTGSSSVELNTTTLKQVTNIADYVISQDGTRIVTVDEFGTVFCFDAQSGEPLWHRYAPQEDSNGQSTPHLFLCSQDHAVIRNTKTRLEAFDLQTGRLLWSQSVDTIAKNYLFYNAQRDSVLLASYHTVEIFSTAYQLTEISASTGEILQTIPLFTGTTSYSPTFSHSDKLSAGGLFSKDGTHFFGVYIDTDRQLQYFAADLTQGTLQWVYTYDTPIDSLTGTAVVGMYLRADGTWFVVCKDPDNSTMIRAIAISLDTGKKLWQQDIPEPNAYLSSLAVGQVEFLQRSILIGCNDMFYQLDGNTGEILSTKAAPNVITSLDYVSDKIFGFSTRNGTYNIGWVADTIELSTDPGWNISLSLGEHQAFQVWEGGIVQYEVNEDGFRMGVGNFVGPGYVTMIPKEEKNTVQVIRTVVPLSSLDYTPLELPETATRSATDMVLRRTRSHFLLGPVYKNGDYSIREYYLLDAATGEVLHTCEVYQSGEQVYWLKEQPLICSSSSGLYTLNADGTKTQLYDPKADQGSFWEKDAYYTYSLFRCASEYLYGEDTLLSAACNPETLQVWKSNAFSVQTDLPEPLLIAPGDGSNMTRLLKVGENGWIVTSLHEYNRTISAEKMAAYDPVQDKWSLLQSDAVFSDDHAIALAKGNALMAGMDQDGNLLIFDLNTGNVITHFPTQIPSGSVEKMQFFRDDTCLALKAAGGHLLICEVATGKILYRDQIQDTYSNTLEVFEDNRHGRLYLNCGTNSGLCLDMDSWTLLGQAGYLYLYDSDRDLVYLSASPSNDLPIVCGQIPDTAELVALANALLVEAE